MLMHACMLLHVAPREYPCTRDEKQYMCPSCVLAAALPQTGGDGQAAAAAVTDKPIEAHQTPQPADTPTPSELAVRAARPAHTSCSSACVRACLVSCTAGRVLTVPVVHTLPACLAPLSVLLMQAPPALELGPSAVSGSRPPSLGDALEAGYAAARQAVRSSNGIRVLLMLLQVRARVRARVCAAGACLRVQAGAGAWRAGVSGLVPGRCACDRNPRCNHRSAAAPQSRQHLAPAAADRVRALACQAVLGLARDASIRHILAKLQVGKLLAELVREPLGPGAGGGSSSRREVSAGSEGGAGGNTGARACAGPQAGGRCGCRCAVLSTLAARCTDAPAPRSWPPSHAHRVCVTLPHHANAPQLVLNTQQVPSGRSASTGRPWSSSPSPPAAAAAPAGARRHGWQRQQPRTLPHPHSSRLSELPSRLPRPSATSHRSCCCSCMST
jgi:hypothetical protein